MSGGEIAYHFADEPGTLFFPMLLLALAVIEPAVAS